MSQLAGAFCFDFICFLFPFCAQTKNHSVAKSVLRISRNEPIWKNMKWCTQVNYFADEKCTWCKVLMVTRLIKLFFRRRATICVPNLYESVYTICKYEKAYVSTRKIEANGVSYEISVSNIAFNHFQNHFILFYFFCCENPFILFPSKRCCDARASQSLCLLFSLFAVIWVHLFS